MSTDNNFYVMSLKISLERHRRSNQKRGETTAWTPLAAVEVERTEGVEPPSSPWSGDTLPLSYVRIFRRAREGEVVPRPHARRCRPHTGEATVAPPRSPAGIRRISEDDGEKMPEARALCRATYTTSEPTRPPEATPDGNNSPFFYSFNFLT
jgi:hypothetical protein